MSDEDSKLLRALRDYRPPKKLHKIAMFAWALYEEAGRSLPAEAIDALRDELKGYGELKDLTDALCGLSAFMIYVSEHLGDPDAAERVAELVKEMAPRYEPLGDRVSFALENFGKQVKGAFDRLVGSDEKEEKRAPIYGEAPPKGTIPLKTLKPVAEPPPWARKKR